VQLKEFFGAYAHATNLIKKLQKNVDNMHVAGILDDIEKQDLTNNLQLKRQTL
jgi:DNA replication initiation complex subunit (GINS family)